MPLSTNTDNKKINSSRTHSVSAIKVSTGQDKPATEINIEGSLRNYTTAGRQERVSVDAINLIKVRGGFVETRENPIHSESSEAIGQVSTGSFVKSFPKNSNNH